MKITTIQQQARRANRYSIYVDGTYSFSLSETALLESGITSGKEIDAATLREFKQLSADDKLFERALRYALMRPRSEWELRDYLRRKEAADEVVATILGRLRRAGLLDDMAFARTWVENRRLLKATSRRKLQLELRQKHVPGDIIDVVLAEDRDETDERVVLRELIERKRSRYPDQQKLMAYLSRQGYAYDDIKSALATSQDD